MEQNHGSEEQIMTTPAVATRTFEGIVVPEPGTYQLDAAHTVVGFVARYLMVTKVRGSFGEFSGSITVAAKCVITSPTASVPGWKNITSMASVSTAPRSSR